MKLKSIVSILSLLSLTVMTSCGRGSQSSTPAGDPNSQVEGYWFNAYTMHSVTTYYAYEITPYEIIQCVVYHDNVTRVDDVHLYTPATYTYYAPDLYYPPTREDPSVTTVHAFYDYDSDVITDNYGKVFTRMSSADYDFFHYLHCGI